MKKYLLVSLISAFAGIESASATTIDFNSDTSYHFGNGLPYQEDGFSISNSSGNGFPQLYWGTFSFNANPGGNTYSHNYGHTTSTLTKVGGGAFAFNSIELGDVYNGASGGDVKFNFTFSNFTNSTEVVSLDSMVGLQTFSFNKFNVISVDWMPLTTYGGWIQLDNIVLDSGTQSSVPEPSSLILVALGLAGLTARRMSKSRA